MTPNAASLPAIISAGRNYPLFHFCLNTAMQQYFIALVCADLSPPRLNILINRNVSEG